MPHIVAIVQATKPSRPILRAKRLYCAGVCYHKEANVPTLLFSLFIANLSQKRRNPPCERADTERYGQPEATAPAVEGQRADADDCRVRSIEKNRRRKIGKTMSLPIKKRETMGVLSQKNGANLMRCNSSARQLAYSRSYLSSFFWAD